MTRHMKIDCTGKSYELYFSPNICESSCDFEILAKATLTYCGIGFYGRGPREQIYIHITEKAREKLGKKETSFLELIVWHHNLIL